MIKSMPHRYKKILFISLLIIIWTYTRYIAIGNPEFSFDHGNHLLISQEMVEGDLVPYQDFRVSHMPGLYWIIALGFRFGFTETAAMTPYIYTGLLLIWVTYYLGKKTISNKHIKLALVLVTLNYYVLIFSTKSTADMLITPIALVLMYQWLTQRSRNKSTLMFMLGFSLLAIFKLSIIYIWISMFIAINSYFIWISENRLKTLITASVELLTFLISMVTVLTLLNIYNPNILPDVVGAHLIRERLPFEIKLNFLILAIKNNLFFSLFMLATPIRVINYQKMRNKSFIITLDFFVYTFLIMSVLIHKTFYIHHLLIITIPCLILFFATIETTNKKGKLALVGILAFLAILDFGKTTSYVTENKTVTQKDTLYYNNYYNWVAKQRINLGPYTYVPDIALKQQDKKLCDQNECNKDIWEKAFEKNAIFIAPQSRQPHIILLNRMAQSYYKGFCLWGENYIVYYQDSGSEKVSFYCENKTNN